MRVTNAQAKRLLAEIKKKSAKVFLHTKTQVLTVADYSAIEKIVNKGLNRLK